jgi:hypothetical protein
MRCVRMNEYDNICHAWSCFGECSQWGYWTRLRTVEGWLQPKEFESPTPRTVFHGFSIDKFPRGDRLELVLSCVQ